MGTGTAAITTLNIDGMSVCKEQSGAAGSYGQSATCAAVIPPDSIYTASLLGWDQFSGVEYPAPGISWFELR